MRKVRLLLALAATLACDMEAARAQGTPEQREACTADALKICASTIPDVALTTACMKAHRAELSTRCRAAMAEAAPASGEPAVRPAPRKAAPANDVMPVMRRRSPVPAMRYIGDPDAEVPYVPPRRIIQPPLYGDPGPPLNPGGVPYDDLFNGPSIFDLPEALAPPRDPYLD